MTDKTRILRTNLIAGLALGVSTAWLLTNNSSDTLNSVFVILSLIFAGIIVSNIARQIITPSSESDD